MEISKNNNIFNQDIIEGKRNFKLKIYDYFFNMLTLKREPSYITLYIFHTIEIIQMISFAFSPPHTLTWNISEKNYKYIYYIITGFRLTPLIHFTSLFAYRIIFFVFFAWTLVHFIFLFFQILFRKNNSKIYEKFLIITQSLILPLKVVFIIPVMELFLTAFKCDEGNEYTHIIDWSEHKCWTSNHLFYIILGVFAAIILLIFIYIVNYYYFYPFFVDLSTIRLNSTIDQNLIFIKIIYLIQLILIKNEYTSLAILIIFSLLMVYSEFNDPIYNVQHIEIFLNIRNVLMLWTYFMLLIAKMCSKSDSYNNMIYLLVIGYPLVIFSFIKYYRKKENDNVQGSHVTFNNINSCLNDVKILMKLINSFIKEHFRNNINYQENLYKKDIIMLKGIIEIHTNTCLNEDCPLTKFVKSEGNYNLQKQSLLSHMTSIFNTAMKTFPHDISIRILYVQFNYDQKYNLNSVKTTFDELRKMQKTNKINFIIYCQESIITSLKLMSESDAEEQEQNEKLFLENSYQRMKNLISNITKLYAEFWGIFEAKVTNNLNMQKLYKLGEKLNLFLKELNDLWENELKDKKLDFENESVAQLYAMFLREILWDKKKSDLVVKKINEEHNLHINNKIENDDDETNYNHFKLDSLESQDYIIFLKSNEKGNCTLLRFSASLSFILGYERYEIINKPFEILLPPIYKTSYASDIHNYIKASTAKNKNNNEDNSLKDLNKNRSFILIKNKMGYIIPFYIKYSILEDNDFSDSFLIRLKLENVDIKSIYAFYILTRNDFSVESISSSAIHLGFSMDLLKKYVIKLNILIRTNSNKNLNLFERYKDFENYEKKITWVFPDKIYPKNDSAKNNDKNIQDLINESEKAKFYLQIMELRNQSNDINGFIFKLFELHKKKNKKKKDINNSQLKEFLPSLQHQIIFDLLNLKYIRTIIVQKKSGLRNLREEFDDNETKNNLCSSQKAKNIRKKRAEKEIMEESEEDDINDIKITKEKLLELQTKDSNGIKSFINSLFFYGKEISLIRHRPNREKYPAGKAQEPLIKISMSNFTKRIALKIKENPNFFKKNKTLKQADIIEEKNNSKKIEENDNSNIIVNQDEKMNENKNNDIEEINKDLFGDNTLSLKNIVNVNSLVQIKILGFIIFIIVVLLTIIEFIFANNFYHDQKKRYKYFKYSYDLLNSIVYIKYFVTEGVLADNIENYSLAMQDENAYLSGIKKELSNYHILFSNIISKFSSPDVELSEEYKNYITNLKEDMKTWNNGEEKIEYQPLPSAQTKLLNALVYLSNSSPEKNVFDLNDKYVYELMNNLLNSHYTTYEKIISLMKDDFSKNSKSLRIKCIIFFSLSLLISFIFLYLFYNLMLRLDNDREKPVNLFLTIKNKVFEDLKNSSENFSNKLLNKFFGVDENEEEPQQNYNRNLKPNDINITKFIALNENKINNYKGNSFIFYYAQLVIFYIALDIVMLLKYLDNCRYYKNIKNYIIIYDSIRFSEINIMTRIDMTKQYFEDPSVGNYDLQEESNIIVFLYGFITLSNKFSDTIEEISKTKSFLKNKFKRDFIDNFYRDFTKLINLENTNMGEYSKYGFKAVILEIFEMLKYIYIKYFIDDERDANNGNISKLINHNKFLYIHVTLKTFFRPWFEKVVELIDSCFYSYIDYEINLYMIVFIIMLILIAIFYLIIWKHYEEEFLNKIEMSFDLINLIPEEIKTIIVSKLNEAN